jgi:hypothetical protein
MLELLLVGGVLMVTLFVFWIVFAVLGLVVKIALFPLKLLFGLLGGLLIFVVVVPLILAAIPVFLVFGGLALLAGLLGLGFFAVRA